MKKISEYVFLGAIGGTVYYNFEILFRGFSHWTMFLLGGICMMFFAWQGQLTKWQDSLLKQLLRCTLFVVSSEFTTGIIVNKWLNWNVWDYSDQPLQIFGQICLPFAIIFAGLCTIGIFLSGYLLHWLYREDKPSYHVL